MRTSILFITLIAVVSGTAVASDAPLRMQRKIAKRGDCVTCHRTIIPTETNTAMELRKETFHEGTLLCQYQSVVKGGDDEDDDGDGADGLEPKEDVEDEDVEDRDEDEENREDAEEDVEEDEEDKEDKEDRNEGEEDRDDADEDADEDEDEEDEDEEDEDEKDEEECDPNDKYERRALGTRLDGAQDLRSRDDNSEQSNGYTVEYVCVYDVASGNLLEDQAKSCPPVVSSSC
ncbi:hypothetical protein EV121DRAFT_290940 [Schizophyllum commune]